MQLTIVPQYLYTGQPTHPLYLSMYLIDIPFRITKYGLIIKGSPIRSKPPHKVAVRITYFPHKEYSGIVKILKDSHHQQNPLQQ